jgi:RNA polymerase sigma-70 factor (ECF subfamily)
VRTKKSAVADAEAFEWFFAAEYPRVVRSLSRVVRREDAEDVAQEAFARLHQHWAKVSRYEQPDAWVRRVALNRAISLATRESRRRHKERAGMPPDTGTVTTEPPDGRVAEALLSLPPRQRALIVLYYYEDRPLAESGELLGMSPGAAKVALHRARRRVAAMLALEVADDTR